MKDKPLKTIEREVKSWAGVTTGDTGRGGLQFSYGRVELGHEPVARVLVTGEEDYRTKL